MPIVHGVLRLRVGFARPQRDLAIPRAQGLKAVGTVLSWSNRRASSNGVPSDTLSECLGKRQLEVSPHCRTGGQVGHVLRVEKILDADAEFGPLPNSPLGGDGSAQVMNRVCPRAQAFCSARISSAGYHRAGGTAYRDCHGGTRRARLSLDLAIAAPDGGFLMLCAQAITLAIGGKAILRDVSLSARAGEITAIVGPNDSGKTSLLRVLTGETAAAGRVRLERLDVHPRAATALAARRGVLPQATRIALQLHSQDQHASAWTCALSAAPSRARVRGMMTAGHAKPYAKPTSRAKRYLGAGRRPRTCAGAIRSPFSRIKAVSPASNCASAI